MAWAVGQRGLLQIHPAAKDVHIKCGVHTQHPIQVGP